MPQRDERGAGTLRREPDETGERSTPKKPAASPRPD